MAQEEQHSKITPIHSPEDMPTESSYELLQMTSSVAKGLVGRIISLENDSHQLAMIRATLLANFAANSKHRRNNLDISIEDEGTTLSMVTKVIFHLAE